MATDDPRPAYHWNGDRKRAWLCFLAVAIAVPVAFVFLARTEAHVLGMTIASAALGPILLGWLYVHGIRTPVLVSVSADGITPHEWTSAPIPWDEITSLRFESRGVHRHLVIETTQSPAVRQSLRPLIRAVVRVVGWWPISWGNGIAVTLSLLRPADRDQFLGVLAGLGHAPAA